MATVADTRKIFEEKKLSIKLPLQDDLLVTKIDIVERYTYYDGDIHYLIRIEYINEKGYVAYDLFPCEGRIERKTPLIPVSDIPPETLRLEPLPMRDGIDFASDEQAYDYIKMSFSHFVKDKGYEHLSEHKGCDLYCTKGSRGLFTDFILRCDDDALDKVKELIELRGEYGSSNDYAIVFPAIQESLSVKLLFQENWFRHNGEFLAAHRICAFGVNNSDPNLIYPFTVYPREKELARYFMFTGPQWNILRNKYVESR